MSSLPVGAPQEPKPSEEHGRRRPMERRGLPKLLDIEEVAEHLGVNVRHMRRLVAERRVPFVKWGHLLRFDPGELADWLDSQRVEAVADSRRRPRGR